MSKKLDEILEQIYENPVVRYYCRDRIERDKIPRLVKFSLNSTDVIRQAVRKSRFLRSRERYKLIYVWTDQTVDGRKANKLLADERSQK